MTPPFTSPPQTTILQFRTHLVKCILELSLPFHPSCHPLVQDLIASCLDFFKRYSLQERVKLPSYGYQLTMSCHLKERDETEGYLYNRLSMYRYINTDVTQATSMNSHYSRLAPFTATDEGRRATYRQCHGAQQESIPASAKLQGSGPHSACQIPSTYPPGLSRGTSFSRKHSLITSPYFRNGCYSCVQLYA